MKKASKPPRHKQTLQSKKMTTSKKLLQQPSQNSTQFHGPIHGPVSSGSGDLIIGELKYGIEDAVLYQKLTTFYSDIQQTLSEASLNIISTLSIQHQRDVAAILDYISEKPIPSERAIALTSAVRAALDIRGIDGIFSTEEEKQIAIIQSAIESPTFGIDNKLKISIPIIPLILQYEGEIDFGSKIDLEKAWDWLKSTIVRKSRNKGL